MYKFAGDNALVENMYMLISIFKNYNIEPIFVFDGKPPPEKKQLLIQRKIERDDAFTKYLEIKDSLEKETFDDAKRQDMIGEMESLKKQSTRIKDDDFRKVKDLMTAYGVTYYDSVGEADVLCCYLVKCGRAFACVSDDMDMFLYGCNRVIRHLSVLNHTLVYYDTEMILSDLKMGEEIFQDILILSGTDYNISNETNLSETVKWYREYNKFYANSDKTLNFYNWLEKYSKYIKDKPFLEKIIL
jgi:flap endonuclease-1